MTTVVRNADLVHVGEGRFKLYLDGNEFPWHLHREEAEVTELTTGKNPVYTLMLPVLVDGTITGVAEFNEKLADEVDASRVRRADRRDARLAGVDIW